MRIKFTRKAKASWTTADIEGIKVATRWCAGRLGFNRLPITIVVRFIGPHPSQFGACSQMEDDRFIIWLQSGFDFPRTVSTLFHEMTHVRQYLFEGLLLHSDKLAEFRDDVYREVDYWTAPWEREARRHEKLLLEQFIRNQNA